MQVQPYLFFEGRADEAIEFYKKTLGATVEMLMRWKDAPEKSMCTPGNENKVMHSCIKIGEVVGYKEALEVFDDLRDTILRNYRLDLHNPLDIAGDTLARRITYTEVPEKFPFCLAGLLACRGSIAADYEGRPEHAACYFIAARFSAQMLLRALDSAGMSDGELATLPERTLLALTGALQAQAKHDGKDRRGRRI